MSRLLPLDAKKPPPYIGGGFFFAGLSRTAGPRSLAAVPAPVLVEPYRREGYTIAGLADLLHHAHEGPSSFPTDVPLG